MHVFVCVRAYLFQIHWQAMLASTQRMVQQMGKTYQAWATDYRTQKTAKERLNVINVDHETRTIRTIIIRTIRSRALERVQEILSLDRLSESDAVM